MQKLNEIIAALQAQQAHLEREKRKIAFLNHILQSVKDYQHAEFKDVHADVLTLVSGFVAQTIASIENPDQAPAQPKAENTMFSPPEPPAAPVKPKRQESVDPAELMAFAMENRHLSGKSVVVTAPQGQVDIKGTVVGLEAPFVLVKTNDGPTIKVPLEKLASWS